MKVSIDLEADALLIQFRKGRSAKTIELDKDTNLDLDAKGLPLAIEMLNVTQKIPIKELRSIDVSLPIKR